MQTNCHNFDVKGWSRMSIKKKKKKKRKEIRLGRQEGFLLCIYKILRH